MDHCTFIRQNYYTHTIGEMMRDLGKSKTYIENRIKWMNLPKLTKQQRSHRLRISYLRNNPQIVKRDQIIKKRYLTTSVKQLAREIGCSHTAIRVSMARQGLKVPQHLIDKRKKESQFQKGRISPNKGMKQTEFIKDADALARARRNCFKKGHKPHNTKQQYTISERAKKGEPTYLYIKLDDGNWELYHRYIWQKQVGPIPTDHIIAFKDGNTKNCDISNLVCVSKKQHMLNNSILAHGPELAAIQRLVAQINKRL